MVTTTDTVTTTTTAPTGATTDTGTTTGTSTDCAATDTTSLVDDPERTDDSGRPHDERATTTSATTTPGECAPVIVGTPPGGGQVGLLMISPWIDPGKQDVVDELNHFSVLKGIEQLFKLPNSATRKSPRCRGSASECSRRASIEATDRSGALARDHEMFTSATHLLHDPRVRGSETAAASSVPPPSDSGESVKRLCLLGMAMAGLLTAGISTAATAKPLTRGSKPAKAKPAPKPVTTKVSCQLTLVLQPTAKVTTIVPGTGSGSQSGTAKCPGPVGGGVQTDKFTTDDAGDMTAPYTQWFKGGTLAGQYTLIPTAAASRAPATTRSAPRATPAR